MSDGPLRRKVEVTAAKLDKARARYAKSPSAANGRALLAARDAASAALSALWDACPQERPPGQVI